MISEVERDGNARLGEPRPDRIVERMAERAAAGARRNHRMSPRFHRARSKMLAQPRSTTIGTPPGPAIPDPYPLPAMANVPDRGQGADRADRDDRTAETAPARG